MKTVFTKKILVLIVICGVLIIFSFISPLLFTLPMGLVDFTGTGSIGDTISGTMSPFIAIAGVILTFLAFYIQYEANEKQKKELVKQGKEISKQNRLALVSSFERNLFELIHLHQAIVDDMEIEVSHHRIIHKQDVFKLILETVNQLYQIIDSNNPNMSKKEKLTLVYLYVFYGNSLIDNVKIFKKYGNYVNENEAYLRNFIFPEVDSTIKENGFSFILSRYFRNLFQIYKYINSSTFLEETNNNCYFYARLVRSTLSSYEQVLLYYNLVSPMGKPWINENFVIMYRVIKNIPFDIVNTYSPSLWIRSIYPDIQKEDLSELFEYYEDDIAF